MSATGEAPIEICRAVFKTHRCRLNNPCQVGEYNHKVVAGAVPRRKAGIVGGGMAGVSLAWLLDGARDVVLLEARASLGGNIQSIPLEVDGEMFVVDMGAQYFHPGPYPTYVKLLALLDLLREVHSFPASITLDSPASRRPVLYRRCCQTA
jgi:monoamine oxidase